MIDGFCKQNGERTDYNKKGSNEEKKWRVAVAPDYYTRAAIPEMVEAVKSAKGAANRLFE